MRALFSIHPNHAEEILAGRKKFEFRKKIFARKDVTSIVIYATSPVCRVIGEFDVGEILEGQPDYIWNETQKFAGVEHAFFQKYFEGRERAYAISVKNVKRYKKSKGLDEMIPFSPVAPQSFRYLAA